LCIYYQLVTHDVPLMISWVECVILRCYYQTLCFSLYAWAT
jgi:hypothetical protein